MILAVFRKIFAISIALIGGWLLIIYGTGHVRSASLTGVKDSAERISVSAYLSADALVVVAEKKLSSVEPEDLALRALSQDPANGGAAALLLTLFSSEGREAEASAVADLAGRLWPVHIYTHARLADYWISQDRIDKLLPELDLLMTREPSWRKSLFPFLEQLTLGADKVELLAPYIKEPPNWWDSFFIYISSRFDIAVVSDIYERRLASDVAISDGERKGFVRVLLKEKRWSEAFEQWQGGLDATETSLISNGLFDGSFEGRSTVNREFGWVFARHKSFSIKPRPTYGATGKKALQLSFKRGLDRIRFKHLSQRLLLEPGHYQLSFKARADALKNPKGLVWRIRCESQPSQLLAEGEPLLGRHQWQKRSFTFTVPESCLLQSLVLEAVSKYPHELVFNGKLWLDDVVIKSMQGEIQ